MNQDEKKLWESMKNYVNLQISKVIRSNASNTTYRLTKNDGGDKLILVGTDGGMSSVDINNQTVTPITATRIKEICTHTGEHIGVSLETSDVKSKITLTSNFTLNRATLFKFGNTGTIEMNLTTTSSFSKDVQFKMFSVPNSWIKAGVVSGGNLSGAINVSGNAWVTTQTNLNSGSSIDVVASVALA